MQIHEKHRNKYNLKYLQWFNSTGEFMDEKFCLLFVKILIMRLEFFHYLKKKMELPRENHSPSQL